MPTSRRAPGTHRPRAATLWKALIAAVALLLTSTPAAARSPTKPVDHVVASAPPATATAATTAVPLPPLSAHATVDVFFSPGAGTDEALVALIGTARTRVWIAGYYFTSSSIARALERAFRRGVDVRVVLDRSQATLTQSSATYFHDRNVPLWIDARYPVMHHKFLVVDEGTVGFGSMNFTRAGARHNAENFNLFRHWTALAGTYAREFERLRRESVPYVPGMVFEDRDAGDGPH
jgi:phosphatidylserine/phosphatidylglycerophosphate/cardiolipin synthase-like enzyme